MSLLPQGRSSLGDQERGARDKAAMAGDTDRHKQCQEQEPDKACTGIDFQALGGWFSFIYFLK